MSIESEVKKNTMAITNLHEYLESLRLPELLSSLQQAIQTSQIATESSRQAEPYSVESITPDHQLEPETLPNQDEIPTVTPVPSNQVDPLISAEPSLTDVWETLTKLSDTLKDNGAACQKIMASYGVMSPYQLPAETYRKVINQAQGFMNQRVR